MTPDERVRSALTLARSDAEVERAEGVSWLLAHPELTEPVLVAEVSAGRTSSPELALRLLAAIGGAAGVPAIVAALERGRPGEAFWAAQALAEHPAPAAARALRQAARHPDAAVRAAVAMTGRR